MNVVDRVTKAHKDVNSNWFEQRKREESAAAARLIVSAFAVLVACVAIASIVMSVIQP